MYLNRPAVLKVLTDLRSNVAKFAISFDYLTEAVINYATGDERISAFVKRFAEMGAPWTFGVDDLDALAGDAGLTVVNDVKMAELFGTFWQTGSSTRSGTTITRCARSPRRNSSAIPAYTVSSIRRKALSRLDRSPDKGVLRQAGDATHSWRRDTRKPT